jgi:hypothetical protein
MTVIFTATAQTGPSPSPSQVCSQGSVNASNLAGGTPIPTDDPDTDSPSDPTCTAAAQLPVELTAFDALVDGSEVVLSWQTQTETNNAGFDLEHQRLADDETTEATDWTKLGFIEGAGTTTRPQSYAYRATDLDAGHYRFRIKQLDFDGTFVYSPIVEAVLEVPRQLMLSPNYPNPFNPSTQIEFTVPSEGRALVEVYSIDGRLVRVLYDAVAEPSRVYRLVFDAARLSTGEYVYVLKFNGRLVSQRMVLVK